MPGYRPFCITSASAGPQFVWDNFIEPLYLDREAVMLFVRGIPDVSYKVENGMFVDNFEESGVHLGVRSPFNPDIKFPYTLPPLVERGVAIETKYDGWFSQHETYVVAEEPSTFVPEYDAIYKDMKEKKNQLFWKYVLGEHSFDDMVQQFGAYKKEVGFDDILSQINEGL